MTVPHLPFSIQTNTVTTKPRKLGRRWAPPWERPIGYRDETLSDREETVQQVVTAFTCYSNDLPWDDLSYPDGAPQAEVDAVIADAVVLACLLPRPIHGVIDAIEVCERFPYPGGRSELALRCERAFDAITRLVRAYYPYGFDVPLIDMNTMPAELERLNLRGRVFLFYCSEPRLCFSDLADAMAAKLLLTVEKQEEEF